LELPRCLFYGKLISPRFEHVIVIE
jgi:hypothetical protein